MLFSLVVGVWFEFDLLCLLDGSGVGVVLVDVGACWWLLLGLVGIVCLFVVVDLGTVVHRWLWGFVCYDCVLVLFSVCVAACLCDFVIAFDCGRLVLTMVIKAA